jgi:hypothetical protein
MARVVSLFGDEAAAFVRNWVAVRQALVEYRMDVNNNELVSSDVIRELWEQFGRSSPEVKRFTPVPEELEPAAEKVLAGRDRAFVSKTSGGKLSRWAAEQRKAKRKAQKRARRRNRK